MATKQPSIDQFVAYIKRRGIADRFEPLYRKVAEDLLQRFKKPSLDMLGAEHVKQYVAQEEQRLQNVQVVCVALDAFYREGSGRPQAKRQPPPPRKGQLPAPAKSAPIALAPPESSAAYTSPDSKDQRRFVRVPFVRDIEVEGTIGNRASADLSIGGIYVEMGAYTPIGAVLQIRFKLEDDEPPIRLAARVVEGDPGGGVGLSFLDASPEVQARIQRYVERVVRG